MKDRIPLSNGNNNSVKFDLTGISSWEEFLAANTAGTLKADVFANNDGSGTEEIGTALNKANLLTDATATKLGLDTENNPTVNDAFNQTQDNIDNVEKIGDIKVTARTDLGDNWLLCNGAYVDYDTYTDLFNVINPSRENLGSDLILGQSDYSGQYSTGLISTYRCRKITINNVDYLFEFGKVYSLNYLGFAFSIDGITWTTVSFGLSNGTVYDMILVGTKLIALINNNGSQLLFDYCDISTDISSASNWTLKSIISNLNSYSIMPSTNLATDGNIVAFSSMWNTSNSSSIIYYMNISDFVIHSYVLSTGNSVYYLGLKLFYNNVDSFWYLLGGATSPSTAGFALYKLTDFPSSGTLTTIDAFTYSDSSYVYHSEGLEFSGKIIYRESSTNMVYYHEKYSTSSIGTSIHAGTGFWVDGDYLYISSGVGIYKYDSSFTLVKTVIFKEQYTLYSNTDTGQLRMPMLINGVGVIVSMHESSLTYNYSEINGNFVIPSVTLANTYVYIKALD